VQKSKRPSAEAIPSIALSKPDKLTPLVPPCCLPFFFPVFRSASSTLEGIAQSLLLAWLRQARVYHASAPATHMSSMTRIDSAGSSDKSSCNVPSLSLASIHSSRMSKVDAPLRVEVDNVHVQPELGSNRRD